MTVFCESVTKRKQLRLCTSDSGLGKMSSPIAGAVADSQVFQVAAAALALGADVLQRGIFRGDVLTADPAGNLPM